MFLLFGAAAHARDGVGIDLPKFGLPGVFGSKSHSNEGIVQLAQAGDPRVTALEEEIRKLNGTIEELNFQLLQMQEQMRKMQEDNEFRFQELEGGAQPKKSDASGNSNTSIVEAPQAPQPNTQQSAGVTPPAANSPSVEDVIVESGTGEPGTTIDGSTGAPPTTFGTITVDKNGNVVSTQQNTVAPSAPTRQPATQAPAASGSSGTAVAALPSTDDPDELYRNSYQFVLSGDYNTAEQGFRDHISRFPADPKTADARFWLGESLLGQKKYRDAAEIFLAASKEYPKSKKAPDMMLKLGVSLVGLKQREVACATFNEIGKRYPDASGAIKERVKQERALAAC